MWAKPALQRHIETTKRYARLESEKGEIYKASKRL